MLTVPWLVTHSVQKLTGRDQPVVASTGTTEQQQQIQQQREQEQKSEQKQPEVIEPPPQPEQLEVVQPLESQPEEPEVVQPPPSQPQEPEFEVVQPPPPEPEVVQPPPPQPKEPEVVQPTPSQPKETEVIQPPPETIVPDIQPKEEEQLQEQQEPFEEVENQPVPQTVEETTALVIEAAVPQATNGLDVPGSPQISKKNLTLTPSISANRMSEAWANQQVEKFQFNFDQADKDKSGSLSQTEVYTILQDSGFKGSETEAYFIFSHLDKNKDKTISKEEFAGVMKNMPRLSMKEFALRKAFLTMDADASGFLTRGEIEDGITMKAGLDLKEENFSDLLIYLCKEDKDKKVSYEEFLYVFGIEATAVELRRIFLTLDADASGKLSRDEILEAVKSDFELKLKAEQISDLLIKYTTKFKATDKSITYDEFVDVWLKQKKERK